jgi:hypothetical protein
VVCARRSALTLLAACRVPAGGLPDQHYMFIVSRQAESSNWQHCWMVDAVKLLGDNVPLQVLQ